MSIKIGCNTLYPEGRLVGETTFTLPRQLRALEIIAEAGFDAAEYSHGAPLAPDELVRVAEHARSLGVLGWSAHAWQALAGDESQIEPVLAKFRDAAQMARLLEVSVLVVHSGGSMEPAGLESRRRANSETLAALAEMVGPGITVAVENCGSRADWEFLVEMVSACPAPNVGLNIDTGHANIHDLGVEQAIRMAGGRIRTTHLQDNYGQRDDHLPPGEGTIDFVAALRAFREVGYQGVYMVEITDCPHGREPDPVGDTRRAAQNLRRLMREAWGG